MGSPIDVATLIDDTTVWTPGVRTYTSREA